MREKLLSRPLHIFDLHVGVLHHPEIDNAPVALPVNPDDSVIAVWTDHRRDDYYHDNGKQYEYRHHGKRIFAKPPHAVLEKGPGLAHYILLLLFLFRSLLKIIFVEL